jgi:hypothetical protein
MNESIYQAWHRDLGHAEYRVSITMSGHGTGDDEAVAFLDGYLATHADLGPVVSQNSAEDTITITFALRATNEQHAIKLGAEVWAEGGEASGLEPGEVVRAEVERFGDGDTADCDDRGRVYA